MKDIAGKLLSSSHRPAGRYITFVTSGQGDVTLLVRIRTFCC